jgi:hypothetical protein
MNEGLLRQRRNLFTVCLLLWALKYGQVQFTKASFAGFDVTFHRPEVLYLALWASYAYFLYRYYQYFVRHGAHEVSTLFEGKFERLALNWMAKVHRQHPEWETKTGYPKMWELVKCGFLVCSEERIMENGQEKGRRSFEVRLNPAVAWTRMFASVLEGTFRSTVGTDYLLPFVIALTVLLYCGRGDWPGSLSEVLIPRP